jgi:hypothetical protein
MASVANMDVGLPALSAASAASPGSVAAAWSPARRLGFRWLFGYVVLYMLQPSPLDFLAPGLIAGYSAFWERIVKWTGAQLFGVQITVLPNASGDTTYNYVQVLCYAIVATVAALVWTALDRRRLEYRRLYDWLRAAMRMYLAIFMVLYGAAKVIKTQFPDPSLISLNRPLGDLSPNALLWTFMGASVLYTFWVGLLEMVGGLLLVSRRTTPLGALLCIGVMSNVVVLNLSYDVVVKLFSLHLLALAIFLAAPDARRVFDLLARNRAVPAAELRPLLGKASNHRALLVFRTVALVALTALLIARAGAMQRRWREEVRRTPLYGTWNVEALTLDGVASPPGAGDGERWRRVIFDSERRFAAQGSDGGWRRYSVYVSGRSLELSQDRSGDFETSSSLAFTRPDPARLVLEGTHHGKQMRAVLRRAEPREFLLTRRGFHWINEGPVM